MARFNYCNPVHPNDFADPFVWAADGGYFAIGTGRGEASGAAAGQGVFPLLTSSDLVHWQASGRALTRPDPALGDTFWAPEVVAADGRWYLYYSVGFADRRHQLRVAVAPAPQGPYIDTAQLTDPEQVAFAIDPHPFRDEDGRWFLFHARDFLDTTHGTRAGTALVVQPLATMTQLAPGPVHTVARARLDWQRFAAGRAMYGATYDWHTLEGPCVVRAHGLYWCLYSGGNWQNDSYGVDFVSATQVLGAWVDEGDDAGPRVLRTVPDRVIGPGHCSVVASLGEPGRRFIVYHAWDADGQARRMCIDPLQLDAGGPGCGGPSWTPQVM